MDARAAVKATSLLNDSAIIGLIRQLLVSQPCDNSPQTGIALQSLDSTVDDARDQAGSMLWDMAAVQEHATVMAVSSACPALLLPRT